MRPGNEDIDDEQAEEENKIINEVWHSSHLADSSVNWNVLDAFKSYRNTKSGEYRPDISVERAS